MRKKFDTQPSYFEALFLTIPGSTGILLFLIISSITVTSLRCVRRRAFQLFAWVHFTGVPLFLILLIVHGSDSWFNWGFPLGLLVIPPACVLCSIHYGILIHDTFFRKFYISDISITDD